MSRAPVPPAPLRDRVLIDALRVDCVVGILDHERRHLQPVVLDVELGLEVEAAARSGELSGSCDYARVAHELSALMIHRRYWLLESAAEELAAMILALHPAVETVRLRLDKPEALSGLARGVGVEVNRARVEASPLADTRPQAMATIYASPLATLRLVRLAPDSEHPLEAGELAWLVAGEAALRERSLALPGLCEAGSVLAGARGATIFLATGAKGDEPESALGG